MRSQASHISCEALLVFFNGYKKGFGKKKRSMRSFSFFKNQGIEHLLGSFLLYAKLLFFSVNFFDKGHKKHIISLVLRIQTKDTGCASSILLKYFILLSFYLLLRIGRATTKKDTCFEGISILLFVYFKSTFLLESFNK